VHLLIFKKNVRCPIFKYIVKQTAQKNSFLRYSLLLRIYIKVLKRLREGKVNQKISVDDVFFELSKIQNIVEKGGKIYFMKASKRAKYICALNL